MPDFEIHVRVAADPDGWKTRPETFKSLGDATREALETFWNEFNHADVVEVHVRSGARIRFSITQDLSDVPADRR